MIPNRSVSAPRCSRMSGAWCSRVFSLIAAAKGRFINEAGLLGFAMWEAAGDSNDMLLDSIENAMQLQQVGDDECILY